MTPPTREQIIEWYRADTNEDTWEVAASFCDQLGAKLFYNINGTREQLDFLLDKIGNGKLWLGIFSTDLTIRQSVNGGVIDPDMIVWGENYPDRTKAKNSHVSLKTNTVTGEKEYLVNIPPIRKTYSALCDMLSN